MKKRQGFTLIEIITVLLIVGVLAAVAGLGIVSAARGYVLAKDNSETAQKAQLAMTRLTRELIELMDVTSASSTGLVYERLDGQHSIGLVGTDVKLRNGASLPDANNGDVLIDRVGAFSLQYFNGASPWVAGTDDVNLLSAISIDLTVTRTDGSSQLFNTLVSPRNNGNTGGITPSSETTPPVYSGCFIGTANESSPDGSAPALALLALVLFALTAAIFRRGKAAPVRRSGLTGNRRGAILVGIIVTILIFAVLGAAMVSLTTTSTMNEVASNFSSQAYYLAESGYRYAATEFLNEGDTDTDGEDEDDKNVIQQAISDHGAYSVATAQQFDITVQPYYFATARAHVANEMVIQALRPGQEPPDQPIPSSGQIKVNGKYYIYSTYSGGTFTLDPSVSNNATEVISDHVNVNLVTQPATDTSLTNGGNLVVADGSFFPDRNGTFRIRVNSVDRVYAYETRSGNTLLNVTDADAPTRSFSDALVAATDRIVLEPFVRLISVGTVGQGVQQVSRQVMYRAPVGLVYTAQVAGEKQTFADTMDNMNHWIQPSVFGEHAITDVDGNSAMRVTNTYDWGSLLYPKRVSLIALKWDQSFADFNSSWIASGKYLSYDVQAKIRALNENYYMAGLNIRMNLGGSASSIDDLEGLGVSLMRVDDGGFLLWDWDGIPDEVTPPVDNTPLAVLWRKTSDGLVWLAYRELSQTEHAIAPVLFYDDMESGTANWTAESPWALVTSTAYSPTHSWHDSPSGDYDNRLDLKLTSAAMNLSGASSAVLTFWHRHDLENNDDFGRVEISVNNGSWNTLESYTGNQSSWTKESITLSSAQLTGNVRIRFRLDTDNRVTRDGWYIDDVSIEKLYYPSFDTLLVRLEEKTAEENPFNGQRVNDLRVYLGTTTSRGTPDGAPTNALRAGNPRWTDGGDPVALSEVVWPPADPADWDAAHDRYTLIRNWVLNTNYTSNISLTGTTDEPSAILRLNTHTTDPNADSFTRQEIGLHTFGNSSTSVYFDDFAIQMAGTTTSGSRGYRAPIQE